VLPVDSTEPTTPRKQTSVSLNVDYRPVNALTKKYNSPRATMSTSLEQNKSAWTNRAGDDNHVIDWNASTIFDGESDRSTGGRGTRNRHTIYKPGDRDQSTNALSHTLVRFLATSHRYHGKNRKKNKLLPTEASDGDRNVEGKQSRVAFVVIFT